MGALLDEQELQYVREGLARLGLTSLKQYYDELVWICKRNGFAKRHKPVCKCGETQFLSLHHKTYKNLGRELDEDLEWMCGRCHDRHHKKESFEIIKQRNKVLEDQYLAETGMTHKSSPEHFQKWLNGRRYYNLTSVPSHRRLS